MVEAEEVEIIEEPTDIIEPQNKPLIFKSFNHSANASFYTLSGLSLTILTFLFASLYGQNIQLQNILNPYIIFIVAILGIPVGLFFWLSVENQKARKIIDAILYPELKTKNINNINTDELYAKTKKFKQFLKTFKTYRLARLRLLGLTLFVVEVALTITLLTENVDINILAIYLIIGIVGLTLCLVSHLLIPYLYRKELLTLSSESVTPTTQE